MKVNKIYKSIIIFAIMIGMIAIPNAIHPTYVMASELVTTLPGVHYYRHPNANTTVSDITKSGGAWYGWSNGNAYSRSNPWTTSYNVSALDFDKVVFKTLWTMESRLNVTITDRDTGATISTANNVNKNKVDYTMSGLSGHKNITIAISVPFTPHTDIDTHYATKFSYEGIAVYGTPAPPSYTLTIDANGGSYSGSTSITKEKGETYTLSTPSRSSYSFSGWTTSGSDWSGNTFTFNSNGTAKANWTYVPPTPQYTLTVDLNGGTYNGPSSYTRNEGSTINLSNYSTPTRSTDYYTDREVSYRFKRWSWSNSNGSGDTYSFYSNGTATANWYTSTTWKPPVFTGSLPEKVYI